MGFHLDHFPFDQALAGPLTDAHLQVFDQGLVFLHGAGADRHVVVFGEDPGVEVRRDIGADVHLGQALVVAHLFGRKLDPLLEGDGHVVIAGIHRFGDAAVGTIGANDQIHLKAFGGAGGRTIAVVRVLQGVGTLALGSGLDLGDQTINQRGPELGRTVAQEGIHHLPAAHTDVFVLVIQVDLHFTVGGGDHPHVADLAVDDAFGQVELFDHAERNGATAGLGVVELALKDPGLNSCFRQNFRSTGATGPPANNGNTQHSWDPGWAQTVL